MVVDGILSSRGPFKLCCYFNLEANLGPFKVKHAWFIQQSDLNVSYL